MNKDLLKLFTTIIDHGYRYEYYQLEHTPFMYVHRPRNRWIETNATGRYVSFEHVLDSVDEETQTQLLFHLDYFLAEMKDDT